MTRPLRSAALAAEQPQPVAWVPLHPREGPLWAMATAAPDRERLPCYPLAPVYFAPPPPAAAPAEQPQPDEAWTRRMAAIEAEADDPWPTVGVPPAPAEQPHPEPVAWYVFRDGEMTGIRTRSRKIADGWIAEGQDVRAVYLAPPPPAAAPSEARETIIAAARDLQDNRLGWLAAAREGR